MSEDKNHGIIPSRGGVFNNLALRIKLVLRLLGDRRVNPLLKILPIGSVLYFLVPDLAIGPIDDVLVVWLGSYLFIELCPPEVVQEHIEALTLVIPGEWREPKLPEDEVIEGEFRERRE